MRLSLLLLLFINQFLLLVHRLAVMNHLKQTGDILRNRPGILTGRTSQDITLT